MDIGSFRLLIAILSYGVETTHGASDVSFLTYIKNLTEVLFLNGVFKALFRSVGSFGLLGSERIKVSNFVHDVQGFLEQCPHFADLAASSRHVRSLAHHLRCRISGARQAQTMSSLGRINTIPPAHPEAFTIALAQVCGSLRVSALAGTTSNGVQSPLAHSRALTHAHFHANAHLHPPCREAHKVSRLFFGDDAAPEARGGNEHGCNPCGSNSGHDIPLSTLPFPFQSQVQRSADEERNLTKHVLSVELRDKLVLEVLCRCTAGV